MFLSGPLLEPVCNALKLFEKLEAFNVNPSVFGGSKATCGTVVVGKISFCSTGEESIPMSFPLENALFGLVLKV